MSPQARDETLELQNHFITSQPSPSIKFILDLFVIYKGNTSSTALTTTVT